MRGNPLKTRLSSVSSVVKGRTPIKLLVGEFQDAITIAKANGSRVAAPVTWRKLYSRTSVGLCWY